MHLPADPTAAPDRADLCRSTPTDPAATPSALPCATDTETLQDLVRARLAQVRQTELAFRAGISVQSVYNYATGRSVCHPRQVPRLAAALGIAPERLAAILKRALEARIPAPS